MAGLVIHPRHAPTGKIKVWLGVRGMQNPPQLSWSVNGSMRTPLPPSDLRAALPAELQKAGAENVFAGLFTFDATPGTECRVRVTAGTETAETVCRALPNRLPEGQNDWFNLLLVSCFHQAETLPGGLRAAIKEARETAGGIGGKVKQLHLSLLMGDQVYLDLPTIQNFQDKTAWLAQKFDGDYKKNWFPDQGGPYPLVLNAAPSICVADDHEYWNNFPYLFAGAQNTFSSAGRDRWREAAQLCCDSYQGRSDTGFTEVDLAPLHLLAVDSRKDRDPSYQGGGSPTFNSAFPPNFVNHLRQWVTRVNASDGFGVFVTGQSMLDEPAGSVAKKLADATLANFQDYPLVMRELARLKNDFLLLTGDVHYGRITRVVSKNLRNQGFEVIVSPASLVTSVGADGLKKAGNFFKGLFGSRDPWPRHGAGEKAAHKVSDFFTTENIPLHGTEMPHQVGDHVGVLSFRLRRTQAGPQVLLKMRYCSAHRDADVREKTGKIFADDKTFLLQRRSS